MHVQAVAIICVQQMEEDLNILERRVLLVLDPNKPEPHYLKFVGGRVEEGEEPHQAANREALEEAGLRLQLTDQNEVYNQVRRDHLVRYFLCEADLDALPRQGDENGSPLLIVTEHRLGELFSGTILGLPEHVDALRRIMCMSKAA